MFTAGRRMRVAVSPAVESSTLARGQTVRLNEAMTVVEAGTFERTGEVCALREVLLDAPDADGSGARPPARSWSGTPTRSAWSGWPTR